MSEYLRDVPYFTRYYTDSANDVPAPKFTTMCIVYFIVLGSVLLFDEKPSNVIAETTLHCCCLLIHSFRNAFNIAASSWNPLVAAEHTILKLSSNALYETNDIDYSNNDP